MVSFQNSTDFSPWQFQQVKYLKVPNFCIFYLEFVFFRCHHDCSDPGFWALCTEEQQQGSAAIVHADACYFPGRHSNGGIGSRRDSSAAEVAQIDPRKPLGPRSFLYRRGIKQLCAVIPASLPCRPKSLVMSFLSKKH